MKKRLKTIGIIIIALIFLAMATCEPAEPEGEVCPYMSEMVRR